MVLTRSQVKKEVKKEEEARQEYWLNAISMQRITRSKLAELVDEEDIARNPITTKDLIRTHPREAMDYLAYMYGAKLEYMRCGWQVFLLANILSDSNLQHMIRVFHIKFFIPPRHFKRMTREEVLELFFKKFFNEAMETLTLMIDKLMESQKYHSIACKLMTYSDKRIILP
jgi:hypothetical protein